MKEFIILLCISIILFIVLYIFNNTVEQFAEAPVTIDPMMVLLRGILTLNGSRTINPSISDSRLRLFAEDAADTGNETTFMLNIDAPNINWPGGDKSFSSFFSVVVNPPADKPLMAALKGLLYAMIKPTITLSKLEESFKKAAVDNTLTKDTTMKFMEDIIIDGYWKGGVNPGMNEYILNVLGAFKKAYDAENAVKTGAATLASYEPANTADPLMIVLRGFLKKNGAKLDDRITDLKLRLFADDAFKTDNISLFKRNVGTEYADDDHIKRLIKLILDPAITTSNDPIIALFKKLFARNKPTLTPLQVRGYFDTATQPTMTYSKIKTLYIDLGLNGNDTNIRNDTVVPFMSDVSIFKEAADAEKAAATRKADAEAAIAANTALTTQKITAETALAAKTAAETALSTQKTASETALSTQKTASEMALSTQKTAAEAALAAAKEAAKKELDDARAAAKKELDDVKAAAKKELDDAKAALVDAKKDAADTALAAKASAEKVLALEKAAAAANTAAEAKAIADAKAIAEKDAAQKALAAKEAADVKAAAEKDAAEKARVKADADKAAAKAAAEKAAADKADAAAAAKAAAEKTAKKATEKTAEKAVAPAPSSTTASASRVTTGITNNKTDVVAATTGDRTSSNVRNVEQNRELSADSKMPLRMSLRVPASIITESDDTMLETDLSEMDLSEIDLSELDLSEMDMSEMATYPNAIQQNTNSRSTMQQQNTIPLVEMPKPMRRSMQPSRPSCSSNCQDEYSDDYTEDCN